MWITGYRFIWFRFHFIGCRGSESSEIGGANSSWKSAFPTGEIVENHGVWWAGGVPFHLSVDCGGSKGYQIISPTSGVRLK